MAKIGIFTGTVYGNALLVAEEAQPVLEEQGHEVKVFEDASLADWQAYSQEVILIVTSTTGQGDFPDNIARLYVQVRDEVGYQPALRYGVIALGDSSYENFCGAGKTFDATLQEQSAKRIGDVLLVDATEDPEPESVTTPWVESWGKLL
ncbi:flavodoxin [Pantoea sp. BL1]|uniref:Flavodoxin n=1 Tax=Pantoea rwandensis TaxID=1076550 RepID=A0ABM5RGQ7_9GAMM|nr:MULTISPECIES: flavodoxin [Erwiniaceae]HAU5562978.1 flavodoxin [Serratia fonticola]AIR85201.1 flavodoxin [Pantoea rwandensis]KJV47006.1 flavodoxin [Pantoea sp. BL1]MBK0093933.1 flavodoxin [Erwinia sp. S59]MBK0127111.1 flavodoxin [Pantoea sp. S61]